MARKPTALILDSWSVIAYLEDEPAGKAVADLIADAHETDTPLLMSVINVGEVWYLVARATSEAEADRAVEKLTQLGIDPVEVDWALTRAAAALKSEHRLSYADCFAAALAMQNKGALVTGDPEFKALESDVRVVWVSA